MARQSSLLTPVLIGGSIMLLLSMAVRSSFGLFQIPIAEEFGWLRAEFSLAIAIQNLAWGIGQPIFGAIAERFGDRRAIVLGAMLYAAGLVLSAFAITPGQHQVLEILVGFGIAGTGFGVILAIVGRAASNEQRSLALGIATAAGSGGQVVGPVLAEGLLAVMPWQSVFLVFAGIIAASLLLLPLLRSPAPPAARACRKACRRPSARRFGTRPTR
jgi:MFS family permease